MNKVFCDSPLDHLFLKCLNDKTILMFHLEDRKVYVGSVTKMGEPTEDKGLDQEIEIKPIFSGHRATETMEVFLKTEYRKGDNIKITIKQNKIISATIFNKDAYLYHKEKRLRNNSVYAMATGQGSNNLN